MSTVAATAALAQAALEEIQDAPGSELELVGGEWVEDEWSTDAEASAVPYEETPAITGVWDAVAAEKRIRAWATKNGKIDWAKYRRAFAYYDSKHPDRLSSYKLPHHDIQNGKLVLVRNGLFAAGAAVRGARGGVQIPDNEIEAVKGHLQKHYDALGLKAPWENQPKGAASLQTGDSDSWMELRAEVTGDALDLYIYAPIRQPSGFFDFISGPSVSALDIKRELDAAGQVSTIRCHYNSPGGDIFEALAMRALLEKHPAKVIAEIDALCGSAATLPVMAADEIVMAESATMLVHGVMVGKPGPLTATEHRNLADIADVISEGVENLYCARTGKDRKAVKDLMSRDTYLSSTKALALGFCDRVQPAKRRMMPAPTAAALLGFCPTAPTELLNECGDLQVSGEARTPSPEGLALVKTELELFIANLRPQNSASTTPATPNQPEKGKATENPMDPKLLIKLGVENEAGAVTRIDALLADIQGLTALLSLLGKDGKPATVAEAQGAVPALLANSERLTQVNAQLAEAQTKADASERARLIKQGEDERRITNDVQRDFAKTLPLASLPAYIASLAVAVPVDPKTPPADKNVQGSAAPNIAAKWHDKTFAQLTANERASLKNEDEDLYNTMRAQWVAEGRPARAAAQV